MLQPNRKTRRLSKQSAPHRNKSSYFGKPIQIIYLNDGTHKIIRHNPKK